MCEASLEKQPESSGIEWGGTEEAPSVPGGSFKARGRKETLREQEQKSEQLSTGFRSLTRLSEPWRGDVQAAMFFMTCPFQVRRNREPCSFV